MGCPGQAVGNGSSGGHPRPGRSRRPEREPPAWMRQRFCAGPRRAEESRADPRRLFALRLLKWPTYCESLLVGGGSAKRFDQSEPLCWASRFARSLLDSRPSERSPEGGS